MSKPEFKWLHCSGMWSRVLTSFPCLFFCPPLIWCYSLFFLLWFPTQKKRTFFRAVVTLQDCHCGPTLRTLLISFPETSPLFSFLSIGICLCLFIGQYISSWVSWLREFHSLVESDGRFPTSSFAHLWFYDSALKKVLLSFIVGKSDWATEFSVVQIP